MSEQFKRAVIGDFQIRPSSDASPSTLTYEKVKRMMDMFTPKRITIGGKPFDVYGYHVHESPEGWTVLSRIRDEDEAFDLNAPIGGGVVYINHNDGKLMAREEDLEHLARNCAPAEADGAFWCRHVKGD